MSKSVKIFIIMVCFIISAQLVSLSFLILVPAANATTQSTEAMTAIDIRNQIVVPLGSYNDIGEAKMAPCFIDKDGNPSKEQCWHIPWLAKYIGNMYRYGVVIGSILAVMMIMIGGIMYLIGGLNPNMIKHGKELITGAVTGLVLLLGSYVLLNTINPNLVNLQPIKVEVIKEAINTKVTFCNELPADKYTFTGDSACGKKMTFQSKDTTVDDKGECLGWECPDNKVCVPATPTDTVNYMCKSVMIWGNVSDPDERYLDAVWLYPVQGNEIKSKVYESDKEDRGHKAYYIFKDDFTPNQLSELNAMQDFVLKIELNDTGFVRAETTYGTGAAGGITGATNFLHTEGTIDDEYYVGRDPNVSRGSKVFTGIWINPECVTCAGVRPTKPGPKPNLGDGWITDASCGYFSAGDAVVNGGIRIDIDVKNYAEDTEIDCAIMDMINPGGPKIKSLGAELDPAKSTKCGENAQCASNDCEGEDVGKAAIRNCECNNNSDCNPGQTCKTSYATWNMCVTCKLTGEPDGGNSSNCCSADSYNGICECNSALDCSEDQTCQPVSGQPSKCVPGKKVGNLSKEGDICSDDWECISGDCDSDHWYGLGPEVSRCQCQKGANEKLSCGKGKMCVDVENGCGWNYCMIEQGAIFSVPEHYNPQNDPSNPDWYGLCDTESQCIDTDCNIDWAINNCNACSK